MKRLPLLLAAALALLLAACSQPPASPDFEGQWSGTVSGYPMAFEIQPDGKVHNFDVSYESDTLSATVSSHVTGNKLHITGLAAISSGDRLEFVLDCEVNGDTLTGQYRVTVVVLGATTVTTGQFTLTRAPH